MGGDASTALSSRAHVTPAALRHLPYSPKQGRSDPNRVQQQLQQQSGERSGLDQIFVRKLVEETIKR